MQRQITQFELERLRHLRLSAAGLQAECDGLERDLRQALEAGATVQPGSHFAYISTDGKRVWSAIEGEVRRA